MDKIKIERASYPEEVGVSSKTLYRLVDDFEQSGQELHSLIVLRHGKVAFELYRSPYNPDSPHAVNSFSKSVTSTAAGFAIEEGLFGLDSKINGFFPEFADRNKSPYAPTLTIRHILTMTTGKNINVARDKSKIDWTEDFFKAPFKYEPGTHFHYTNENAYIISALIKRLTGLSLREYLQPRLFEPLGIDFPVWETDRNGIEAGGWGLFLKPEDGAKFIQCYIDKGRFNGKQIIPERWVEECGKPQVKNDENYKRDSKAGYGYQFWMCSVPNTFAARGMFGQQGVIFKDYDAGVFYTSSHPDEQLPMDVLFRHFPQGFDDSPKDGEYNQKLRDLSETFSLPSPPVSDRSPLEKTLSGSVIDFSKQRFLNLTGMPTSFLPLIITYMSPNKHGTIHGLSFEFKESELILKWYEHDIYNEVPFGLDGGRRYGKISLAPFEFTTVSHAVWETPSRLKLFCVLLESAGTRTFVFKFKKRGIRVYQSSTPSGKGICDNISLLAKAFVGNDFLYQGVKILLKLAPPILEPSIRAYIKGNKSI
ncbi:MAG: beta-lactamase family protein [Clostridiales bacterium]|jgi:CubicO group peptidase (beta-lactamase class C family)|nr:beta-lactamase family protein [Clostridiales bacterium]